MDTATKKVWFVTGASKGLGLVLAQKLLQQGYAVAATSRNQRELADAVGNTTASFLPLAVNLTDENSVRQAIDTTIRTFGGLDVVVNNAGYGLSGSVEELTDREARDNFEVNVFGSLNVVRQAMPFLRQQNSGHILNISSIGGFFGSFPGWGIYCATKFAVEGFSESLATEAKAFGIHVTIVEPGYFRTNFLTAGSMSVSQNQIDAYKEVRESQHLHQHVLNGNQQGDPEKAALAMIQITTEPNPPVHLFLGQDAYDMANAKISAVQEELERWKELTVSTGFDA
ncbi:SDR family NAD(P)-dependent oxidoreductase [Spirosoma aureum]|uniref:SDR family NAD(P)-dependent oxidoreductase n=1 Tax=Spirosoma aureum TaxID=2692134 RepID=A0A6G9AYD9_9BACT|nr:oxidoreductase [Spirosoma aureum]QIP17404.1 SDR family NAD(P)-dependent oxidoreductase [Spirosoma aureum]